MEGPQASSQLSIIVIPLSISLSLSLSLSLSRASPYNHFSNYCLSRPWFCEICCLPFPGIVPGGRGVSPGQARPSEAKPCHAMPLDACMPPL